MPKAVNSLSRKLKPLLSNLREGLGINIAIARNTADDKMVRGTYFLIIWQAPVKVWKISSLFSLEQNHARNQAQNSKDISSSEDMYLHQDTISSLKSTEYHAQNPKSEGNEHSEDIFCTKGVPTFTHVIITAVTFIQTTSETIKVMEY